jgi:hypothetical protein
VHSLLLLTIGAWKVSQVNERASTGTVTRNDISFDASLFDSLLPICLKHNEFNGASLPQGKLRNGCEVQP